MLETKHFQLIPDKVNLTPRLIEEHTKLYEGYIKKTNEIREKLLSADKAVSNAVYSDYGELKRQETFALNGARLHEIYFSALEDGADNGNPKGRIFEIITDRFGSHEKWVEEMTASAMSSRGWTATIYDNYLKEISIINLDAHNLGAIFNSTLLVVLDMYEHAYFMDYGTNKKAYIENILKNLNWEAIDRNFE